MKTCTNCNQENQLTAKFCSNCGHALLSSVHDEKNDQLPNNVREGLQEILRATISNSGYVVISIDNFYVQFLSDKSSQSFYMEAVSEEFNPALKGTSSHFKKIGFTKNEDGNYCITLDKNKETVANTLYLTDYIFREIFKVDISGYEIESDIESVLNLNNDSPQDSIHITDSAPKIKTESTLTKTQKKWIWGVAIIILIILIGRKSSNDTTSTKTYYTKKECYSAISKEKFEEVYQYAVDKDFQAVSQLIDQGDALVLPQGTEVYLVDVNLTYNIVRLKGSTQNLWIASGILDIK